MRTVKMLAREIKPLKIRSIGSRDAKRKLLAFIGPARDPLAGKPELPPEEDFTETVKRLEGGLSAAMKRQSEVFRAQGRSDYYAVLCFEEGEQVEAFLKGVGYPDPEARFVDGPVLAKLLMIEIPATKFRFRPLRKPDGALARLVKIPIKRL